MSSINHYVANATGDLSKLKVLIQQSLDEVLPAVEDNLKASEIDIIFISAAARAIPEYGIGGFSPGPNHIYISFDPNSKNITQNGLSGTLYHEIHHCMRWRNPGYGETLGEAMITEGMACLYEEQCTGNAPIYAKVDLDERQIEKAKQALDSTSYDHSEWFFGSKSVARWFGYSYGYKVCRDYALKTGKKASELVHTPTREILPK